ncbi:MAG TPA: aspartate 1-decarboxylase [Fimbriimonadaceae bacterium]|nr:aspartate 1-decarboxylase [Fimbriimonadaceae bacterium]HRJ97476.1 aspartate 1-decarboxylase [Fimbriimonadaceae bacterium]
MLLNQLLKAKLHHARLTYANPEYIGSIEVDGDLLRHVGILDGELVHVWAVDHTARVITYAFAGPKGVVGMNGGAARLFQPGDRVIIAAFSLSDQPIVPKVALLGDDNEIVRDLVPFSIVG